MDINNFIKRLNTTLKEKSCSQIEFYAPQTVNVIDNNQSFNLENIYKVHYLNGNYKFVNLYITFDQKDRLIKASNQNNTSHSLDLTGKEQKEKDSLIELYLDKPSNMGLNQLPVGLQFWPIVFLEQVSDDQIHIFVHILEHKNLTSQSTTNFDCLYIDTQEQLFNEFLPLWV
ncbi:hypothetical protein [Spiroplasma endosymbiont of Diplazon laetatorius]|uniref:hypothetical protein n=1 Tax=Spiroplasma endosymbiont of Diplazon laetatorius TaxID=3066322 RepID=UPI0030CCF863